MTALKYEVFVSDPPWGRAGLLPNGEQKRGSAVATLIYGSKDAVLTDPAFTTDQARAHGKAWADGTRRGCNHVRRTILRVTLVLAGLRISEVCQS